MDPIKPDHYTRWKIQPVEFIRANNLDFYRANVIKYIMRHDAKDGLKDLQKALQYLTWYIEDFYQMDLAVPHRMEVVYPLTDEDWIAAERALYDKA